MDNFYNQQVTQAQDQQNMWLTILSEHAQYKNMKLLINNNNVNNANTTFLSP